MPDRAVVYVDGNNWYHALRSRQVPDLMRLNYAKISRRLLGPRVWVGTRYYIGALKQEWNKKHYANQRRFLSLIKVDDPRISVHLGRLEERFEDNPLSRALEEFLEADRSRLPNRLYEKLMALSAQYRRVATLKEKAVDVMISVDMYRMAVAGEYDAAYLLSADGDYTPLVGAIRDLGRKVYAASPEYGSALAKAATAFIPLAPEWFADCYR